MDVSYLSAQGQRRKAEIGIRLQAAVVVRRRRRRATRVAAVGLVCIAAWFGWSGRGRPGPAVPAGPPPGFAHIAFEVVRTEPARTAGWVVRGRDVSRFRVDDAALAGLLAESGHQQGFMRVGSRVVLMTPVTIPD